MYNTWCLLVESDGGVVGWRVWLVSSEGDSEERLALGCVFEWRRWLVGWIVLVFPRRAWRNGSAFDSRSKGWVFESPCPHFSLWFPVSLFHRLHFHILTDSVSLIMLSTVFEASISDLCPSSAPFFGFMGVAASIIFASRIVSTSK